MTVQYMLLVFISLQRYSKFHTIFQQSTAQQPKHQTNIIIYSENIQVFRR